MALALNNQRKFKMSSKKLNPESKEVDIITSLFLCDINIVNYLCEYCDQIMLFYVHRDDFFELIILTRIISNCLNICVYVGN